jgi:hypothetical protein
MNDDERTRQAILEKLAACDTAALRRLAALLDDAPAYAQPGESRYLEHLESVAQSDVTGLKIAERSYGDSWKKRGGAGAFNMLARKWDRIEKAVSGAVHASPGAPGASPYDVFEHLAADRSADGLIDDVRDLRRYLMLVDAEMLARKALNVADSGRGFLDQLDAVAQGDVRMVEEKEKAYGASWKRGGGIGAFMMLARKWDRILARVSTSIEPTNGAPGAARDNVFEHIECDRRLEPLLGDIRDLRRYLMLVEAEMAARGEVEIGTARDNRS